MQTDLAHLTTSPRPAARAMNLRFPILGLVMASLALGAVAGYAQPALIKKGPVGIICLIPEHNPEHPLSELADFACWTNPEVKGVLLRLSWAEVEPSEGHFDFSVFDQGVSLARKYGKFVGIGVCAGKKTPDWVYNAGAKKFFFTKKRKGEMFMPLPWDPIFQEKWGALIQEMGRRYDSAPEVAYVVMSGPGRDFETYFVDSPEDIATFNQSGGQKAWGQAAEAIPGLYAKAFPHTTLIYGMGPPTPTPEGHDTIDGVVTDLLKAYPHQFGICNASLAPIYDPHHAGLFIKDNSTQTSVGFQTLLPSKGGKGMKGGSLADALRVGVEYQAHYIEVYRVDCDDPAQQAALHEANGGLMANAQAFIKK